jgi:hypothetical protein
VRLYLGAVDRLAQWVEARGGPTDPRELTRTDLSLFFATMSKEWKPSTCSLNFRALQQFFGWLVREEEIDRSPMECRVGPTYITNHDPATGVRYGLRYERTLRAAHQAVGLTKGAIPPTPENSSGLTDALEDALPRPATSPAP